MNKINFSIVIATYNRPLLLSRCIESMLATGESSLDIVVVDDCSSVSYEKFLIKHPWVVYRKLATNSGCSVARNYGIKLAKNSWIVIFDDDDELLCNAFIEIRECFARAKNICYFPVVQFMCSNAVITKEMINENLGNDFVAVKPCDYIKRKIYGDFTAVINKRLFVEQGFFYPNIFTGGENILWMSIAQKYTIPTFSIIISKVNSDALVRLTHIANQIKCADKYAEMQELMLKKLANIYNDYPQEKMKRQVGFVVYKILSGHSKAARNYLNVEMKNIGRFLRICLWTLSLLPFFLIKPLFIFYRKFISN